MSETAYPLSWPVGWDRAAGRQSAGNRFKNNTFVRARESLGHELDLLGARDVILSTNVPLRIDGQPRGDWRDVLPDPGVAVYFTLNGRAMAMARDEFTHVSDNLRSLALAIEFMRGMHRHGGAAMVDRVFTGFTALPGPGAAALSCWVILGIPAPTGGVMGPPAIADEIDAAYRAKAMRLHPDVGGSEAAMAELNVARNQAMKEIGHG